MDLNKTSGAQNASEKKSDKKAKAGGLKFDKLFKFFSKAGIKKFVLILYCVVPLLIVSVGFAAWTIIGNDVQSGSGTFNAYGIINSYDYIELQTTNIGAIDFYATGFVDGKGEVVKTYAFDITYYINMSMCKKLLNEKNTDQNQLNAVFEFCFNSGKDYPEFFNNLSCEVKIGYDDNGQNQEKTLNPKSNFAQISGIGNITYTKSTGKDNYCTSDIQSNNTQNNNHQLSLKIQPDSNLAYDCASSDFDDTTNNKIITLTLRYTLQPNGNDYQELYNLVSSLSNERPMIDVRITD